MSRVFRAASFPVCRARVPFFVSLLILCLTDSAAGQPKSMAASPGILWRDHRLFLILVVGVLCGQLLLIAWLIVSRRRRHRTEEALHRSEARTSAILRMVPDLMFLMTRDGVYLDYHARDPRDLWAPPEHFLGKRMQDVFPPDLAVVFEQHFQQALTSDEPVVLEYALPMPGGERHYETRLVRCDNETIMTIVRDVTSRHQAEENLHKAQAELARAVRVSALGELAAGIAHEVSQPLAAIITNARAGLRQLEGRTSNPSIVHDVLQDIVADGQRASEVITRVRGLAKQEPLRRVPLAINDVIEDVVALSARMLRQRRVTLGVDLASDLPRVIGDRIQLQQVLLNLVSNAADAMQRNNGRQRHMVIRSSWVDGNIAVAVQDSGNGLAPTDVDRIFAPFFTTKRTGMGVGLTISRSIVEAHGGALNLASNSPQGATFQFELPTVPQS
jgi:PAS domain S-box-containing protein